MGADPFLIGARKQIIALAARQAIPAIYPFREDAEAGGVVSYGPNNSAMFHIVGGYTGRILRGDKVADLPVRVSFPSGAFTTRPFMFSSFSTNGRELGGFTSCCNWDTLI